MPFHIGSGCLPAIISNRRIYRIARLIPPGQFWEKNEEFFAQRTRLRSAGVHLDDLSPAGRTTRGRMWSAI